MRMAILLCAFLFCADLSAAENLLSNADFAEGTAGWWSGVSANMKAAGCRQGIEENRWVAAIPDRSTTDSTGVLFGHGVNLQSGKTYRLSYTLSVEKAGTMRHLYQMSRQPYRSLGLTENIPVQPGTTEISATFLCDRPDDEVFRSKVTLFAQAARRQGYSLFRVHGSLDRSLCEGATEDMLIQSDKLDRWDFLLSELKREGIYCHLVIFSFGLYERSSVYRTTFEERDMHKLHLYLGGGWEREHFRYGAETVLNHVNPYTGLAWKDDPAIAFVEFYNEQELGLDRMGKTLAAFPDTKAFLQREWRKWLCARYGDKVPSALGAELKGIALDAAPLPPLYDRKSELANEFALFRMHISTECAKWCEDVVRGTGYNGLITQYNASKKLAESAARWQVSEVVDMHSY